MCIVRMVVGSHNLMQVNVVIAEGDEMIAIKISDQGGGIPREVCRKKRHG